MTSLFKKSKRKLRYIDESNSSGSEDENESVEVEKKSKSDFSLISEDVVWATQKDISSNNHAERFLLFYNTMKQLNLLKTLSHVYRKMEKETKGKCLCSKLMDGSEDGNVRVALPNRLIEAIRQKWCHSRNRPIDSEYKLWKEIFPDHRVYIPVNRAKIPAHWLAASINTILPDESQDNWQSFQCSHLCGTGQCVLSEHLVWESASYNQSRGNSTCRLICRHPNCTSGNNMCQCNGIHLPPCIGLLFVSKKQNA
ncbi:MAG: hypothetical protein KIS97_20840 [Nitrospira sp.]|nr:hypothetical protein [Nitrospira sp.]